jgi:hypothetical protein
MLTETSFRIWCGADDQPPLPSRPSTPGNRLFPRLSECYPLGFGEAGTSGPPFIPYMEDLTYNSTLHILSHLG